MSVTHVSGSNYPRLRQHHRIVNSGFICHGVAIARLPFYEVLLIAVLPRVFRTAEAPAKPLFVVRGDHIK